MAKLFMTVESERTNRHQIGNQYLEIKIYYGSKDDSKLLSHILVEHSNPTPKFYQYNRVEPKPMTLREQKC